MKHLKVALFAFNLLIWLSGCTLMVVGAWLLMDPSKGHLLNLFAADATPSETMYYVAYALLGLGLTILSVGFIGCRAALRENQCALGVYMTLLLALILSEIVVCTILGIMAYRLLVGFEARLIERLSIHYGHETTSDVGFSHSLDFAQYKFNCCGIYNDTDFNGTAWWKESSTSGTKKQVPLTCCVLKDTEAKNTGSPMSVISRVFYKNNEKPWLYPQPKDESSCQSQDVAVHASFRNKEGCMDKIRDWLQTESLTFILFGSSIAGAQAFGIMTSAFLCRRIGERTNG